MRLLGEAGRLTGAVCQRMTLGEPDASGRPRPVPVPGSEFTIPADAVLAAIGQEPEFSCLPSDSVTALTKGKAIAADPESLATALPGVFAGGDVVTGPRTVVEAMAAGRRAAEAIDRYLRTAA
ncbi:MAG: FAD-dependent oxidoreductase [Deltaproteobacteria bacterium]|nr:FAD-dependent oxidoreductase [Deltaproteobacteria bacterium]